MENSLDLDTVVAQTVKEALFQGFDFKVYYVENVVEHIYAIITSSPIMIKRPLVALLARIDGLKVFIEVDTSGRGETPLYKALMGKGIPREQMVLTYLGEQDPDEYHNR